MAGAYGTLAGVLRAVTGLGSPAQEHARGMSSGHDIHGWLGGYPYASAHRAEVKAVLPALELVGMNRRYDPPSLGALGSSGDKYALPAPGWTSPTCRFGLVPTALFRAPWSGRLCFAKR